MTIHRRLTERNLRSYRTLLFSDEFSFQLCPDKHRRRVWRWQGQRADLAFTIADHTGPQQGVIVWYAIYFEAGYLWSYLEAHQYVDGILRTVLLTFFLQYPGLIFHQDNAKSHTTHVAMNSFTAYQTLLWPSISPEHSPIEHVWDMMGKRLHLPGNVDDLA
ncbi:transposable element Tc1 transposase [Trichonephila clavipes]|nr:transposable element Tc1 transposase [Trichonephila clavipes]